MSLSKIIYQLIFCIFIIIIFIAFHFTSFHSYITETYVGDILPIGNKKPLKVKLDAQINENKVLEITLNVQIFDLSKELEPALDYANISCKKSAKYVIETTLCIHDHNVDFISKFIWNNGVFEGHILGITNVNLIKKK